jgi:hypothetical protein
MHTSEEGLRTRIQERTGTAAIATAFFFAFQNIEENVRQQLQKFRPILGFQKRSLFEASCMTSAAADCAKSNRFDRLKPNRPRGPRDGTFILGCRHMGSDSGHRTGGDIKPSSIYKGESQLQPEFPAPHEGSVSLPRSVLLVLAGC